MHSKKFLKFSVITFIILSSRVNETLSNLPLNEFTTIFGGTVNFDFQKIIATLSSTAAWNENDQDCLRDLFKVRKGIAEKQNWALKMVDSWGKLSSGILDGNFMSLGSYDECIKINDMEVYGKYCLASVEVDLDEMLEDDVKHLTELLPMKSDQATVRIGTCFPNACMAETINKLFQDALIHSNQSEFVFDLMCSTNEKLPLDYGSCTAIAIFSTFGLLILMSTIYDAIIRHIKKTPKPLFVAFSAVTNISKILKTEAPTKDSGVMECLLGIKCLSIIWIVFGHSHVLHLYLPLLNNAHLLEFLKEYYAMLLINATTSVDAFLLISGLLVTWNVFKELDRVGKISIPMMYIHRFIRITPVLAASVLFSGTLFKYFGSGPLWNLYSLQQTLPCEKAWFTTMLFIQNYVNPEAMCVVHAWYLAVDTQLFLLSPLILIPLHKWRRRFIWILPLILFASVLFIFVTFMVKDYSVQITEFVTDAQHKMSVTYYPTHARIGPWMIGVLVGYFLHQRKNSKLNIPNYVVILGWLSTFLIILIILEAPYELQQLHSEPTTVESALYESLSRIGWSLALSWIVIACTQGYGGLINDFLSHPIWQPLGRIQYSIYMTHLIVIYALYGSTRTTKNFDTVSLIIQFWGNMGIIITVSVIVVLAFESPFIALEKIIFKRYAKKIVTESRENLQNNVAESRNSENS